MDEKVFMILIKQKYYFYVMSSAIDIFIYSYFREILLSTNYALQMFKNKHLWIHGYSSIYLYCLKNINN